MIRVAQYGWRGRGTGEEEKEGGDALAGSAGKKEHVRGARAEPGRNLVEGGDAYDWRNGDNVWGGEASGGEASGGEGLDGVRVFAPDATPIGHIDLPEHIFGEEPNTPVMHQAYVRQMANARQGTASTKNRGAVSGGGAWGRSGEAGPTSAGARPSRSMRGSRRPL